MLPDGEAFAGRSLPVVLKNYTPRLLGYVVLYAGYYFGIFSLVELLRLYAECDKTIKPTIEEVLGEL